MLVVLIQVFEPKQRGSTDLRAYRLAGLHCFVLIKMQPTAFKLHRPQAKHLVYWKSLAAA